MEKKLTFITLFFVTFSLAWATKPEAPKITTKLDLRTSLRLQSGKVSDGNISLLVKGDQKKVEALTKKLGGTYKYGHNNISSVSLPEKNLITFSNALEVEKIQNPNSFGTSLMDKARMRNNIDSANAGYAPLTTDLKGRGVIIGIIDGGIYFQHPDFRHPDGTTRIRYIWDQTVSGTNAPEPYNYGNQWNWIDINSGNCTAVEKFTGTCADFSHGSCVAGIAAGNGLSVTGNPNLAGKYTGVAPESEIIAVNVGSGTCYTNFFERVADAVDYIFKKADALGMPCVINTSVGNYYGSRDGLDLTSQLIDALLEERNGRAVVAAAGNAGHIPYHVGYTITADSAYTFFKFAPSYGFAYFDWWADTADFNKAFFAIGCNDTLGADLGRTNYLNVLANFNPPPGQGIQTSIDLFGTSSLLGKVAIQATLDGSRYHIEVQVTTSNRALLWRLQTQGTGKFDLWSNEGVIGSSDIVSDISGVRIQYPNYKHGDYFKTLVTSWQCSDKVITVGNYSNRTGYFDVDSNFVDLTSAETVGKRYRTSSWGPTRDNRMKPDIMATGSTTVCTGDLNDVGLKLNSGDRFKVALGGKHVRNGGTSMASPIVAGVAALYFEKRPNATHEEIKKALILTAISDSFTGITPNFEYGNGKVNAFQALTYGGFIYGATDTGCINYNATANMDTNGCVAKIYGCMDTIALNYNPDANVSANNCEYEDVVSVGNLTGETVLVRVIPNPFTGSAVFRIQGLSYDKATLVIYNHLAQRMDELKIVNGSADYSYQNNKLAKGIYTYTLLAGDKNVAIGKLVVQ